MRGRGAGDRAFAALLRLYPARFREEFGPEMAAVYRARRVEARHAGVAGRLRLWRELVGDMVPSAVRERRSAARSRRPADPCPPPYGAAALAGAAVWALYVVTLAPTIGFWDAGEYTATAHILGIPHSPGNPTFVFLARAWELLLLPLGIAPAVAINLFSATASALTHFFWFLVADRVLSSVDRDRTFRRVGAWAAVALSATAFTVWSQSNVNEKVYTLSLLSTGLVSWLVLRWRDRRDGKLLLVAGYATMLSATNHLMGLLVGPSLLLFVLATDARALARPRLWGYAAPLLALALTAQFFLPIRAADRPLILEAEPACESLGAAAVSIYSWGAAGCEGLSSSLRREQYGKPPITADPTDPSLPRTPAQLGSQLLNWFQYFDWQWARSVAGADPLLGGGRPLVSLLFLALGAAGVSLVVRRDRAAGMYLLALFLTLSLGLVLYLNFKYGWSIGRERFPVGEDHEVRERDYFFLVGFSVWGLLAGIGLAGAWRRAAAGLAARRERFRGSPSRARLAAAPVLALALLPLALNWSWASRADDWTARDWAYNVLMSVEPYGILVTNGDNDSFPLWYAQKVEGIRRDVTIVLLPYLNTAWYVRQLRDLTRPCPDGRSADEDATRILCQRPLDPAGIPAPLARAGLLAPERTRPPEDTILPLTDEQIDLIAEAAYVTPRPLSLRAGRLDAVIPAGTLILPQDSFVSAILQANLGRRPVHFMAPSGVAGKLGLDRYAVRHGLTLRISDGLPDTGPDTGIVPIPPASEVMAMGRYVDLPRSDTLLEDVYLRRGRVADPEAPWTDPATTTVPLYYAWAHVAAAQGHARLGAESAVARHLAAARRWEEAVTE